MLFLLAEFIFKAKKCFLRKKIFHSIFYLWFNMKIKCFLSRKFALMNVLFCNDLLEIQLIFKQKE